jgi:hypothetical protein
MHAPLRHRVILSCLVAMAFLLVTAVVLRAAVPDDSQALAARVADYFSPLHAADVAVVTCNMGQFDRTRVYPMRVFAFNDSNLPDGGAFAIAGDEKARHEVRLGARMRAKFPKMSSHSIAATAAFRAFAWIDASVQVHDDGFVPWLIARLGDADAAFFYHPSRATVQDELDYCIGALEASDHPMTATSANTQRYVHSRYAREPIRAQMASYARAGFNASAFPLLAAGVFIRRNSPRVNAAFDRWLLETVRWSVQDQLSLGFVLWSSGIRVKLLPHAALIHGPHHTIEVH